MTDDTLPVRSTSRHTQEGDRLFPGRSDLVDRSLVLLGEAERRLRLVATLADCIREPKQRFRDVAVFRMSSSYLSLLGLDKYS